ncbi:unnamed protein product [Cyprideis torosa]|uniref:GOST seven transmembrane domain-containing protein n=1 Tax=Cyprideis torosa TaxID=163714 RepID=A0A7R8ZN02_9CRUS|nr:unnamed protein product [Cyprideis torosa]CAG0885497.1 unnamed protein product [Cyprideis torosa]
MRLEDYLTSPWKVHMDYNRTSYIQAKPQELICGERTVPRPEPEENYSFASSYQKLPDDLKEKKDNDTSVSSSTKTPIFVIPETGMFLLLLKITASENITSHAELNLEIRGDYGFLSAADYPLLPFYGCMSILYLILGLFWLIVSARQWREILRIQFWIGAVILIGMLEKAMYYAEYQSINNSGQSKGLVMLAEIVSCGKRTIARVLVLIVSLGYGIVKPRLGIVLHRVLYVGALYFVLALFEAYLRLNRSQSEVAQQAQMAAIPIALVDSFLCYWIFSSLMATLRTLRLRRNVVKLNLYRHFTSVLVIAVVASIGFMLWQIQSQTFAVCVKNWSTIWLNDAFWHLLFSLVLVGIVILWRPAQNNQRYAFTPLLDAGDDVEASDDEEDLLPPEAFEGMKLRNKKRHSHEDQQAASERKIDEDLKWINENIPMSTAEAAIPSFVDSDEEIMTSKFELSKMQ